MFYLLHFSQPYAHALHFFGSVRDARELEQLVADPPAHTRAPLLLAAHAAGVRFEIAGLFHESSDVGRTLQRTHERSRYCDRCTPPKYRELRW